MMVQVVCLAKPGDAQGTQVLFGSLQTEERSIELHHPSHALGSPSAPGEAGSLLPALHDVTEVIIFFPVPPSCASVCMVALAFASAICGQPTSI